MDGSGRRPVAAAQVPRVSGGLRRNWDRDRTFGVNCGIFADTVGDPERGLTRVSGDQAGVAFSQSRRRQGVTRGHLKSRKNPKFGRKIGNSIMKNLELVTTPLWNCPYTLCRAKRIGLI